jgi:hypothetical protein
MENPGRLLLWIALVATISSPAIAGVSDVPQTFQRDVNCMLDLLRRTPRVDQVEAGVVNFDGSSSPFVGYRYMEQDGQVGTVRFFARKADARSAVREEDALDGRVVWWAFLNGITTAGLMPPGFGTEEVARRWRLQCGVSAIAVFN